MHKTYSLVMAMACAVATGCGVETGDEPTVASSQDVVNKLKACFVDLGQPDPSVPLSRRYDSSCSTPSPGSFIWKYSWDFGDGSGLLTGSTVTDHTFPFTNSCYKVQLMVIDINGKTDSVSHNQVFCTVSPCVPTCPP